MWKIYLFQHPHQKFPKLKLYSFKLWTLNRLYSDITVSMQKIWSSYLVKFKDHGTTVGRGTYIVYMQMSLDLYKFIYLTACGMTSTIQKFLFPCKTVGTILHVHSIKGFWDHISEYCIKYLSQTKQFLKDVELLIMFSFSP